MLICKICIYKSYCCLLGQCQRFRGSKFYADKLNNGISTNICFNVSSLFMLFFLFYRFASGMILVHIFFVNTLFTSRIWNVWSDNKLFVTCKWLFCHLEVKSFIYYKIMYSSTLNAFWCNPIHLEAIYYVFMFRAGAQKMLLKISKKIGLIWGVNSGNHLENHRYLTWNKAQSFQLKCEVHSFICCIEQWKDMDHCFKLASGIGEWKVFVGGLCPGNGVYDDMSSYTFILGNRFLWIVSVY